MKIMKKNFISMGLMFVAALTLTTNCAKEEVAPEEAVKPVVKEAVPFEFTVSSIGTKTSTTDASTINWVANDKVNVFHAVNGVEPAVYGSNDEFTITSENLAAGKFTGTLTDGALDGEKSYDWYVLYPYSEYITTPANTSAGYTAIGSANKDTPQVQAGYGSKAHLAGQYFPLYGKATNVPAATKPTITLNQALAIVKVHVTNTKETPLTVTSVAFTAPQNIVGTYYINFSGATPTYTSSGADYVSKTANLTVTGGTALAKNETADFYIAIKPFTAAVDSKISIAVNGEVKTLTVTGSAVEFQPGKIKTVNYSFDADPIIYSTGFDYPVVKDGGNTYYNKGDEYEGVDAGGETSWYITYGNWAGGNTAQLRVYNGTGGGFGEVAQKFDCSHVTYVTYEAVANNDLTSLTLTPYYSTDKGANWTAISGDAKVITQTNTTYKFTVSSTGAHERVRVKLVVSGSRPGSSNTQITIDNLKIYGTGSVLADPVIIASNVSDVPALGAAGSTLTYTIKNFSGADDVAAEGDGTVVATSAVVSPAGTVTYTVNPNYGTAARNGSITLSSSAEGINKVVSVAQLGETFSVSGTTITIPKDATTATFTITTPTFGWTAVANAAAEKNLTISGASTGSGSASAQTITVSSTTAAAGDEQTLGTIVVYRNGNESDSQKKTITIKKAPLATVLYSCGFEAAEGFTAGTTYNNTTPLVAGATGYKWSIIYGTPSTNEAISGSNSLQMRHYNDPDTNFGSAEMQFDVTGGPTKVSFYAKVSSTSKIKLTVEYSTDEGANWSVVSDFENKTLTTSADSYNFNVTGTPDKYRLRFSVGSGSVRQKTTTKLTIDDIKFLKVE